MAPSLSPRLRTSLPADDSRLVKRMLVLHNNAMNPTPDRKVGATQLLLGRRGLSQRYISVKD